MAQGKRSEKPAIAGWSWVTAALGLALIAGSVGFLLFQGFAGGTTPPDVVIETEAAVSSKGGYLVPIRVTNHGGLTAAAVTIEGVLKQGPTDIEVSQVALDYSPAGSRRIAGLFFRHDPREFELEVRALGYVEP